MLLEAEDSQDAYRDPMASRAAYVEYGSTVGTRHRVHLRLIMMSTVGILVHVECGGRGSSRGTLSECTLR